MQINERIPVGVGACLVRCGQLRNVLRDSGLLVVGEADYSTITHTEINNNFV